jgi:tetratricopeptide (TPR) repeat protein
MGERSNASTVEAALAQALYLLGEEDEVLTLTDAAAASDPADLQTQVQWRGPRAKVLARRGAFDEAERLARAAVVTSRRTDFLDMRAQALADLAEVLVLAGRREQADEALAEAVALHRRKGNGVSAERLESELLRAG